MPLPKIAGIKTCESYNLQYDTNYICVMPTNLYGPNDNYDLEKSHVLPALIRKMHLGKCLETDNWSDIFNDIDKRPIENVNGKASEKEILQILNKYGILKENNKVSVMLWGTGAPRREFLYSDDMADACIYLMEKVDFKNLSKSKPVINTHINIGTGKDLTIKELAFKVKEIIGFSGEIKWDASKPDGTPQNYSM